MKPVPKEFQSVRAHLITFTIITCLAQHHTWSKRVFLKRNPHLITPMNDMITVANLHHIVIKIDVWAAFA